VYKEKASISRGKEILWVVAEMRSPGKNLAVIKKGVLSPYL
jgi:hypothetical protein